MSTKCSATVLANVLLLVFAMCVAHADLSALKEIEGAFVEIGQKIRPCVVNIDVEREVPQPSESSLDPRQEELFRLYGLPVPESRESTPKVIRPVSSGSGFVYDKEGHIVTNYHVVKDAAKIEVRFPSGETLPAVVVGQDDQTDLAVIRVEPTVDLSIARLGDSDLLQVGQFAIAVGSPQGLEGSLSFGHITALERGRQDRIDLPIRFLDFIQTDAAINLGNSGGPLCNIDGEVIGINVAIVRFADALGFAIPINRAKRIVPELIASGHVTRGYLGVQIADAKEYADADELPADGLGAYVLFVAPGAPAERHGILVYDLIRKVNGNPVASATDLQQKISDIAPGQSASLEIWRSGSTQELTVNLEAYPEDTDTAILGPQYFGIRVEALSPDAIESLGLPPVTQGVIISTISPDSPADQDGLRPNDVILEVAKKTVTAPDGFAAAMDAVVSSGKAVLLRVMRPGVSVPMVVKLLPGNTGE